MDISSLQLCARFARTPNALNYCGTSRAESAISDCLLKGNCAEFTKELKKFKALHSYLTVIAKKHKRGISDYEVVEAYWIGNKLLNGFDRKDFAKLLSEFAKQGVPQAFIEELEKKSRLQGFEFIPHHSFNVVFVGVGNITGSVEYNIENVNNCLIREGKVIKVGRGKVRLKTRHLIKSGEKFVFTPSEEEFTFDKNLLPNIRGCDHLAVHWGEGCYALTEKQKDSLDFYNRKIISSVVL